MRALDRFREEFPAVRDDKTGDRLLVLGRLHIVGADRHEGGGNGSTSGTREQREALRFRAFA